MRVSSGCPSLLDYARIASGCSVEIEEKVLEGVASSRSRYLEEVSRRKVYGYSTGVGALQGKAGEFDPEILLVEHASGVGGYLEEDAARAVMAVRIVQLSRGHSPVRRDVVEHLAEMLNRGVVPAIPIYGSVGASGDLAPLAHLALAATGRGRAWYGGRLLPAAEALEAAGLRPLRIERGEALSLINGTAFSTGLLLYSAAKLAALVTVWMRAIGLGVALSTCNLEHYEPETVQLKRHRYPETLLEELWRAASSLGRKGAGSGDRLQDPYSLRCVPQVVGAFYVAWRHAAEVAVCEACSPSDNPVVTASGVRHQCSFHGVHVALAADYLAIAAAALANAAERRIAHLLASGPPGREFLGGGESPSGMMMAHYTAASRSAYIRQLAAPHSVHNIPTSELQEDYVSMSANAALRVLDVYDALLDIAAVELAVAARLALLWGVEVEGYGGVQEAVSNLGKATISEMVATARAALEAEVSNVVKSAAYPREFDVACPHA
ncbi:MAG: aromatic amino acid ammonia-lyase [Thermoproteota archaeon]